MASSGSLSTTKLLTKRLANEWKLLLSIFAGILLATTLVAAVPMFIKSLERLALDLEIDRLSRFEAKVLVFSLNTPLTHEHLAETEGLFDQAVAERLGPAFVSAERYVTGRTYLAGLPTNPLPPPSVLQSGQPGRASRALLRYLSHFEDHVRMVEGRFPSTQTGTTPSGPLLEGVISTDVAATFQLRVGDLVTATTDIANPNVVTTRIVGIVEAVDPGEDYWTPHANIFMRPEAPDPEDPGDGIYDPTKPPAPIFTTQEALVSAVDAAYPATLIDSIWFVTIDKAALKQWSSDEILERLNGFETQLQNVMPGSSDITTGIRDMAGGFRVRSFYSRVPLLLFQTVIVVMVLFFLGMMVSYLGQNREADTALLRTRGIGTGRLLRLYALEGAIMTVAATLAAPFLAMGAVVVAGKLPYFRDMTGGQFLPLSVDWAPFMSAAAAGVACLAMFTLPAMVGGRGTLLLHKMHASRPPALPLLQRHYIDVGLLVLGGLVFWELYNRGTLVSGGLFQDIEINEPLLLAPVLFLIVVALGFLRLFPLVVRYLGGESPTLVHLVAVASIGVLGLGIAYQDVRIGNATGWISPVAVLALTAGAYWFTLNSYLLRYRIAGYILQAAFIIWFLTMEPIGDAGVLAAPSVGLAALVPLQLFFHLVRLGARLMPVWLSIGLWRMARNPLQYMWLILLLVMVTGVAVMSTTVGGTLEQYQADRVQYRVGADVRVSNIDTTFTGGSPDLLAAQFSNVPGVTGVTPAFRQTRANSGDAIEVLGIDPREFPSVAWYRDDFSTQSLPNLMRALTSYTRPERKELPENAAEIGLYYKMEQPVNGLWLRVVLESADGQMFLLPMGRLGNDAPAQSTEGTGDGGPSQAMPETDWQLARGQLPGRYERPLRLVSVQIYETMLGGRLTPGAVYLDDIHAIASGSAEETVLEDFEGNLRWTPFVTSALAADRLFADREENYTGAQSGKFQFGQDGEQGIRGIHLSPTGGPLPVLVSAGFADFTGTENGDLILALVGGHRVPAVIRGVVFHFPTMTPGDQGFIVAELASLLAHTNVINPENPVRPNEVFLTTSPAAHDSALEQVQVIAFRNGSVQDRNSLLRAV